MKKAVKFNFNKSELQTLLFLLRHLPEHDCKMFVAARDEIIIKLTFKLMQRLMITKDKYVVNLNMTESFFLYKTLRELFGRITVYENMIVTKITNHIHQQTC